MTIGFAPLLALFIGLILRYSDTGQYDFASAYHIPTFLFLTLIVAMFLGLTNSADDIIRDRAVLQRERNLNVRLSYYVFAKTVSLGVFALVQCVLFILIGNFILGIRGMFWPDLAIVFMTAMSGVSLGLVVSALVADPKTAANIVPFVLIPQIVMGGALIKYQDMNRNLDFVYALSPAGSTSILTRMKKEKWTAALQVPFICEFVAMRWSYEELVVAQAKLNPLTKRQNEAQRQIDAIVARHESNPGDSKRLDDLKETLAILSGLEAKTPRELKQYLAIIDRVLSGKKPFRRAAFENAEGPITAEQLFVNQKVSDLISNAEMEQNDYRRGGKPNVFFGEQKRYFGATFSVFTYNTVVLIGSSVLLLGVLLWILRRELEVRRN